VVLAGLIATALAQCGGPLPNADVRSIDPGEAAPSRVATDASVSEVHSMTVTACWRDPARCNGSESTVTTDLYRVASGTGVGGLRSHEQALTDVYRELRDRTGLGSRLVATPHRIDAQADARAPSPAPTASTAAPGSDPLVSAAKELLLMVDTEGQITLDVTHGRTSCKVAVAGPSEDSRKRCLVEGSEHASGYEDPTSPREREKRFGM
jgi:hypothetical protein